MAVSPGYLGSTLGFQAELARLPRTRLVQEGVLCAGGGVLGALLVEGPRAWLAAAGLPELAVSVLADGVGAGLTTVATFAPPIFMIFLCLSLLEESGYMARAAFIMDRSGVTVDPTTANATPVMTVPTD